MDKLVVDASVLCAFFLAEEGSEDVEEVLNAVSEIHAPSFWKFEAANAVWRRRDIPEKIGEALIERLWKFKINDGDFIKGANYAFIIGRKHNIPFYDSSYIALAKSLNAPLWTLDKVQAAAALKSGVSLWGK
ncbi:MAG: type II toxin-antitoxin system VapC family toxin [Thermodesulfovibrionales bacterium]|nr:type II toxin-antitoxin system VapC family toxin [Thermodesulfovibrionales bacterium]